MEADIRWLDDPRVFRVGQVPAHSDHAYYADRESMTAGNCTLRQCLDGEWQFCFSVNAGSRPKEFYREDFDRENWDHISVPMHIEMAGYDKIHYINVMYPWEGKMFRRPACTIEGTWRPGEDASGREGTASGSEEDTAYREGTVSGSGEDTAYREGTASGSREETASPGGENATGREETATVGGKDATGREETATVGREETATVGGEDATGREETASPGGAENSAVRAGQAAWAGDGSFSQASYNPVGSYVKVFDLDPALRGKQVRVCFEGVEQAMYLWLNGHFIGYAEDSFTPSEFLLTPYIREQGNVLAVEVHKRSTASYLEDQDFFRFFGIFRSVYLYAQPALHVEDMWARPRLLQDNVTGSLELDLKLSAWGQAARTLCGENAGALWVGRDTDSALPSREETVHPKEGESSVVRGGAQSAGDFHAHMNEREDIPDCPYKVEITLHDAEGGLCWSTRLPAARSIHIEPQGTGVVTAWDHRRPYLYRLLITLLDPQGEVLELVPYDIGFRRIEIVDKVILLNGKRLYFNGVNRHEWSARGGRVISMEDMEQDIRIFEENNINAVRTCHYPDQIPWYYLCDSHGVYMISETNLETHGSWQKPGGDETSWNVPGSFPQWREVVLDRARTHFETFKNHPAILMWSLGNESYAGENIAAMHTLFKDRDPDRLVHYEGVVHAREYEDRISDVESQMYARPEDIAAYLSDHPKKPFILCEYMHDMGNSMGGMKSYMDLLDRFEMYHGGFIWDYMDQAIEVQDAVSGRKVLRYGGDFDDRPSDYEFSGNGILFADRTPKPALQEVRYYFGKYC